MLAALRTLLHADVHAVVRGCQRQFAWLCHAAASDLGDPVAAAWGQMWRWLAFWWPTVTVYVLFALMAVIAHTRRRSPRRRARTAGPPRPCPAHGTTNRVRPGTRTSRAPVPDHPPPVEPASVDRDP